MSKYTYNIYDLDKDSRKEWLENNQHRLDPNLRGQAIVSAFEQMYKDDLYKERYGEEAFNKVSNPSLRNQQYDTDVLNDEFYDKFQNEDPLLLAEAQSWSNENKRAFLDSDYTTVEELESLQGQLESSKNAYINQDSRRYSPYQVPTYKGSVPELNIEATIIDKQTKNKEIIESIKTKQTEENIAKSSERANYLEQEFNSKLNNYQITESEINDLFETVASGTKDMPGSAHYNMFKNRKELENLSLQDKKKILSTYYAIAEAGDGMAAWQYLDHAIQTIVSENQSTWDRIVNSERGMLGITSAYIPQGVMGVWTAFMDEETKANFLQGKDKYGKELEWWKNPLYWQGVNNYGTWDFNEIKYIQENGGISPYSWITKPGEEFDLLSFKTLDDINRQSGYLWGGMLEMLLFRGAGAVGGKVIGTTGKVANTLNKVGSIGSLVQSAQSTAFQEGIGVFQSTVEEGMKTINDSIDRELLVKYGESKDSEEAQQWKKDWKDKLRKDYAEKNKSSRETGQVYIVPEESILNQMAETAYSEHFNSVNRPLIEEAHKGDIDALYKSALTAYTTTQTISAAKSVVTNSAFRKILFSRKTREAWGDNGPTPDIVRGANGPVAKLSAFKKYADPVIRNFAGEGFDEYGDTMISTVGEAVGLSQFNNYMTKMYDPEAYSKVNDIYLGYLSDSMMPLMYNFSNKESWYEGAIGALAGGGAVNVNAVGAINRLRQTGAKNFFKRQVDTNGNKESWVDYFNSMVSNPILNDIAENIQIEREYQEKLDAFQEILSTVMPDMNHVATVMGSMVASEDLKSSNLMSAVDNKQSLAFTTVMAMSDMASSEIGAQVEEIQNYWRLAESIANDTLSAEEKQDLVAQYISQHKIKNADPNAIFSELQENANKILDIRKTINEVDALIDKKNLSDKITPEVRQEWAYSAVMNKNWKERLSTLEKEINEELGVRQTNTTPLSAIYGSSEGLKTQQSAKEKQIREAKKSLDKLQKDIDKATKDSKSVRDDVKTKAIEELQRLNSMKDDLQVLLDDLQSDLDTIKEDNPKLSDNIVLSREEILSLPHTERARMLDPKNRKDYSPKQQAVLRKIEREFKGSDVLTKIQDARTLKDRILDTEKVLQHIQSNPSYWSRYAKLQEMKRVKDMGAINLEREYNRLTHDINSLLQYYKNEPPMEELIRFSLNYSRGALEVYLDSNSTITEAIKECIECVKVRDLAYQSVMANNEESLLVELHTALRNSSVTNSRDLNDFIEAYLSKFHKDKQEIIDTFENAVNTEDSTETIDSSTNEKIESRREELNNPPQQVPEESTKETTEKSEISEELTEDTIVASEEMNFDDFFIEPEETGENIETPPAFDPTENTIELTPQSRIESTSSFILNSDESIGNGYYLYDSTRLREDGVQERRGGESILRTIQFLESQGIYPQRVADEELGNILQDNPDIEVRYARYYNSDKKAEKALLLVIPFTEEVKKRHKEKNGSIISYNDQEFLVIGTVGYNNEATRKENNSLEQYLYASHKGQEPSEGFLVYGNVSTKVTRLKGGELIKQLEDDSSIQYRSIVDLVEDSNRNPHGFTLDTLPFGIAQGSKFQPVNFSLEERKASLPIYKDYTIGSIFVMIPDADGTLIPAEIRSTSFNEILEGSELKNEITDLLRIIATSTNHAERLNALTKLKALVVIKDGDNILVGTESNNGISIQKNGELILTSFVAGTDNFSRLLEAFKSINPIINISATHLKNSETIKKLASAGALNTDIALLGTSQATLLVKKVAPIKNTSGGVSWEMVEDADNIVPNTYNNKREPGEKIDGITYRKSSDGTFIADAKEGERIIRKEEEPDLYNRIYWNFYVKNRVPDYSVVSKGEKHEYFIIDDSTTNPIVVKRYGDKQIKVATVEEAIKTINKVNDIRSAEERARNAQVSIDNIIESEELDFSSLLEEEEEITEPVVVNTEKQVNENLNKNNLEFLNNPEFSLSDSGIDFLTKLFEIISEKVEKGVLDPNDMSTWSKYLASIGVDLSTLDPNNQEQLDNCLDMIKSCK